MASDRDTLAAAIRERLDSWPNRSHLILPGPYDLGAELVDYLSRSLAGWRPPAQVITSVDQLEELPVGSVVRDDESGIFEKVEHYGDGRPSDWQKTGDDYIGGSDEVDALPAAVLWSPTEKAGTEPALNTLLGDQLIHSCVLPAVETHPHDVSVACACGRQWVRRGLIGWRPVEKAGTE